MGMGLLWWLSGLRGRRGTAGEAAAGPHPDSGRKALAGAGESRRMTASTEATCEEVATPAGSGLRLSLCDTARITPARQPRQQRPLSPRSSRASSPSARHRNRFPTSSGRVSTAIAVTAKAAAASSAAKESTKPRSYRLSMLKTADPGKAAAPRASADSAAHRTLCPEGHSDLSHSVLNTALDSPTCSL
ncbi:hypothetical protein R6Z07M_019216 [Ovis aries]